MSQHTRILECLEAIHQRITTLEVGLSGTGGSNEGVVYDRVGAIIIESSRELNAWVTAHDGKLEYSPKCIVMNTNIRIFFNLSYIGVKEISRMEDIVLKVRVSDGNTVHIPALHVITLDDLSAFVSRVRKFFSMPRRCGQSVITDSFDYVKDCFTKRHWGVISAAAPNKGPSVRSEFVSVAVNPQTRMTFEAIYEGSRRDPATLCDIILNIVGSDGKTSVVQIDFVDTLDELCDFIRLITPLQMQQIHRTSQWPRPPLSASHHKQNSSQRHLTNQSTSLAAR